MGLQREFEGAIKALHDISPRAVRRRADRARLASARPPGAAWGPTRAECAGALDLAMAIHGLVAAIHGLVAGFGVLAVRGMRRQGV